MYKEFFGLREKPFSKTPDPRFLYESRQHAEALARLEFACEEHEIAVLTGDIGSGKTLLSRALIDRLSDQCEVCLIINPILTPREFLATIAESLGCEAQRTRRALVRSIESKLFELWENGRSLTLMIDEAQLIPSKAAFEDIRLLTNFQLDDTNLLTVLFIGQPELRKRLSRPAYRPLAQRIGVQYHLTPFDLEDVQHYLSHRLQVAGCSEPLFDDESIKVIHKQTGGIPRLINTLGNACLISAFAQETRSITEAIATDAAKDFMFYEHVKKR